MQMLRPYGIGAVDSIDRRSNDRSKINAKTHITPNGEGSARPVEVRCHCAVHKAGGAAGDSRSAPQRSLRRGVEVMYGSPMRNCATERRRNEWQYAVPS